MTDISVNNATAISTPDISVVIPVYNSGPDIVKTLDSVCGQSLQTIEVICINDGSTDNTLNYITDYANRDARIAIKTLPHRGGLSHARHKGIELAKGRYIYFIDAGDTLLPNALASLLNRADATGSDITIMGMLMDFGKIFPKKSFYSPVDKLSAMSVGNMITPDRAFLALCGKEGILGSMCDKLYSTQFIKEYMPESVDWFVGEDYYSNACIFQHANKISWTDYQGYVWEYSGMGIKYYLKNWERAILPYYVLLNKSFTPPPTLQVSALDYLKSLKTAFLKDLTDNCALRLLRLQPKKKVIQFIHEHTNQFFAALNTAYDRFSAGDKKTNSHPFTVPDAITVYSDARRHLQNHWKFYIFTHVINLFR